MAEMNDLPQELLAQLSKRGHRPSNPEAALSAIRDHGGTATVDQVLIGIYRNTGRIWTRELAYAVLSKLKKSGVLVGSHGVFKIKETEGTNHE